jgi:hypothetical protein
VAEAVEARIFPAVGLMPALVLTSQIKFSACRTWELKQFQHEVVNVLA